MTSITDPNMSDRFTSNLEEIHNKQLKTYGEIIDTTTELCQAHKQFMKSALDTCLKKSKDGEMLLEAIQIFKKDLQLQNASLQEKEQATSETVSEIEQKEMQKEEIIQKIEKLKEEQTMRKNIIESQNKANKARLRNLQRARLVFENHLGLEIRTISKLQTVKGERLQFVFRKISRSDPESAFVVTMGIDEDSSYQIVSSDPALECMPFLESQLRETNNLAAFLANVRKEFVALSRR